eukprot:5679914-Prymnesium_polylepis.1
MAVGCAECVVACLLGSAQLIVRAGLRLARRAQLLDHGAEALALTPRGARRVMKPREPRPRGHEATPRRHDETRVRAGARGSACGATSSS